jgi:DNA primase catalytic subunit
MEPEHYYYANIFPSKLIDEAFSKCVHREFVFNWKHSSVPKRYNFGNFQANVSKYAQRLSRIEIGPLYFAPTSVADEERASLIYGHTLVFDIDAKDYDSRRVDVCSCGDKQMCDLCWQFPLEAARIISDDLSFTMNLKSLCAYSGRRGIQIWVPGTELYSERMRKQLAARMISLGAFIDLDVTNRVSHCVKCPFSLHDATNKVALPLSIDDLATKMPSAMPTSLTIGDECNADLLQQAKLYFESIMIE